MRLQHHRRPQLFKY